MKWKTPKKILFVDDEKSVREVLSEYLMKTYQVIEADNGFDGLSLFVSEKPDIVLLDIVMPEMDGLELTAKILEMDPDAAIIVISGTGLMMDVVKALKLGAWDFIVKPIQDLVILDHAISKVCEQVEMKQEKKAFETLLKEQVRQRTDELRKTNNLLLQEIEEHKKTEAVLAAKENHYRSIFENAPVGIFQSTDDGQFIDANPAMANMLGYESSKELIDLTNSIPIGEVLYEHPDVRASIIKKALDKGDWIKFEVNFRHKKNHYIPVNLIFKIEWNSTTMTRYLMGFVEKRIKA